MRSTRGYFYFMRKKIKLNKNVYLLNGICCSSFFVACMEYMVKMTFHLIQLNEK